MWNDERNEVASAKMLCRVREPKRRAGFSLVELVFACLIASMIAGGVVGVFRMVSEVESRASKRWRDMADAAAAVDELTEALVSAVDLPGSPGVVGVNDAGGARLTCMSAVGRGLRRSRYTWPSAPDGMAALIMQSIPHAGPQSLAPDAAPGELDPERAWDNAPSVAVTTRLNELRVSYRAAGDPKSDWKDHWEAPAAGVMVRIVARAGGVRLERYVRPRISGPLSTRGSS